MKSIIKIAGGLLTVSLFIMSCAKEDSSSNNGTSNIMLINASPNAPDIDAYADAAKINSVSLSYPSSTNYLSVASGNKSFIVKQGGTNTSLFTTPTFPFVNNKSYSVFLVDSASKASAIILQDNLATPVSDTAHFRILQLSPNTANVDFILRSGSDSIPITNKAFKEVTNLYAVKAKTYNIKVKLAGTETVIATATGVVLSSRKIYTLFLKGFSGGTGTTTLGIQSITNN